MKRKKLKKKRKKLIKRNSISFFFKIESVLILGLRKGIPKTEIPFLIRFEPIFFLDEDFHREVPGKTKKL